MPFKTEWEKRRQPVKKGKWNYDENKAIMYIISKSTKKSHILIVSNGF